MALKRIRKKEDGRTEIIDLGYNRTEDILATDKNIDEQLLKEINDFEFDNLDKTDKKAINEYANRSVQRMQNLYKIQSNVLSDIDKPKKEAYDNYKIAKETGIDTELFAGNSKLTDLARNKIKDKRIEQINKIDVERSPKTASILANKNMFIGLKDEFKKVEQLEDVFFPRKQNPFILENSVKTSKDTIQAYKKTSLQRDLADKVGNSIDYYLKNNKFPKEIYDLENEISAMPEPNSLFSAGVSQLPHLVGSIPDIAKYGGTYGLAGIGAGALMSATGVGLPAGITTASLGVAGLKTGVVKGIYENTSKMEKNLALLNYSREGVPAKEALKKAEIVGMINGSIEAVGDIVGGEVASRLLKPFSSVATKGVLKSLSKLPQVSNVAKELLGNADNYAGMTVRQAIYSAVKNVGVGVAGEVGEEVSQELTQEIGRQSLHGEIDIAEALDTASQVIVPTIKSTLLTGLIGGGTNMIGNVNNIVKNMEFVKQSPDFAEEVIKKQTEDTNKEYSYINKFVYDKVIAENNLPIDEINEMFGIDSAYFQKTGKIAEELGDAKLKIDTAKLLTQSEKIQAKYGIDLRDVFENDISYNENEYSINEMKSKEDSVADIFETEIDNVVKEIQGKENIEDINIQNRIEEIFSNIAKPKGINKKTWQANISNNAKLWSSFIETTAKNTGKPITEILDEINLNILSEDKYKEVFNVRTNFINELKNKGIISKGKIFIPENIVSDYADIIKNNKDILTSDKTKSSIALDEVATDLGISEQEVIDKLSNKQNYNLEDIYSYERFFEDLKSQGLKKENKDITKTEAFKKWFGDSKVVDEKGEPLVVYHGTDVKFNEFKKETFNKNEISGDYVGEAFYFSNKETALKYGKDIIPVYLKSENPLIVNNYKDFEKLIIDMFGMDKTNSYPAYFDIKDENPKKIKEEFIKLGYDGLIDNLYNQYAVFEPTQIKSVENQGTFDLNNPNIYKQDIKGATIFQDTQTVIALFKDADLSTISHEMGHIFLKYNYDLYKKNIGTADFRNMMKDVEEWLGIKGKITVEQQEKFARNFEAYLLEGKSPTVGLRKVFRMFSRWLTNIYKNILNIGKVSGADIEINEKTKYIFDRMLATQEEIDFETNRMKYFNTKLDELDLAFEETKKLKELKQDIKDKAYDVMLKSVMRLKQQEKIEQIKNNKREEVRNAFKDDKIYTDSEVIEKEFKQPIKSTISKYYEYSKKLNKTETETKFIINFENMIDSLGNDKKEFIASVMNSPTLDEMVELVLDDDIFMNHNELLDVNNFKQEAIISLHNDKTIDLMALEQNILEKYVEKGRKVISKVELSFYKEQAKDKARNILLDMKIKDAKEYIQYYGKERENAVKCENAMKQKNYKEALKYKKRQILYFELARQSNQINKDFAKNYAYLKNISSTDGRRNFKNKYNLEQVLDLLGRFKFIKEREQNNFSMPLTDWILEAKEQDIMAVNIPSWLLADVSKTYSNLNAEQFTDLVNAIKNIKKFDTSQDNFIKLNNQANATNTINNIKLTLKENIVKTRKKANLNKIRKKSNTFFENVILAGQAIGALVENLDTVCKVADAGETGIFRDTFYNPIKEAQDTKFDFINKKEDEFKQIFENNYTKKELKEFNNQVYDELIDRNISKGELLNIALQLGTELSREKIFENGIAGVDNFTERDWMSYLGERLDSRDWEVVQSIWNFYYSFRNPINTVHKKVSGYEVNFVSNSPFIITLKDGSKKYLVGGYYPLSMEKNIAVDTSEKIQIQELEVLKNLQSGNFFIPTPQNVKLQNIEYSRTNKQYKIDTNLFTSTLKYISSSAHYIAFREVNLDLNRIINNADFKNTINENLGVSYTKFFQRLKEDIVDTRMNETNLIEKFLLNTAGGFSTVYILNNLKVILQNIPNFFLYKTNTAKSIGMTFKFVSDMLLNNASYQEQIDSVYKLSKYMKNRALYPTQGLDLIRKYGVLKGWNDNIVDFSIVAMNFTDMIHSIPQWTNKYNEVLKETGDSKKAVNEADLLIERVLGSGRNYLSSAVFRDKAIFYKLITMFGTFANQRLNAHIQAVNDLIYSKENLNNRAIEFSKYTTRNLMFIIGSAFVASVLYNAGRDDEDKKTFLDVLLQEMFLVASGVPVFGAIYKSMFDYFNYSISPVENALNLPKQIINNLKKGEVLKSIENSIELCMIYKKIPLKKVSDITFNYLESLEDGDFNYSDILRRNRR